MTQLAGPDLLDRFDSALPRAADKDTARRVLEVMRRISRARTASAYRERGGTLARTAGDRLPDSRVLRAALRHGASGARLTSIWVAEAGAEGWERSWVMWRDRQDGDRDIVYMRGPGLRPAGECAGRLERLLALLGRLA